MSACINGELVPWPSTDEACLPEYERLEKREIIMSPSKRFKLIISYYNTNSFMGVTNSGDYTSGTIIHNDTNEVIGVITRNYSPFEYTFFNRGSEEWFFGAPDCISQILINLETKQKYEKRNPVYPNEGEYSDRLVWQKVYPNPSGTILAVDGCYWCCETGGDFEFYDLSDPKEGWFKLDSYKYGDENYDNAHPLARCSFDGLIKTKWLDDNTFEYSLYCNKDFYESEDGFYEINEDEYDEIRDFAYKIVLRREENKMVKTNQSASEKYDNFLDNFSDAD